MYVDYATYQSRGGELPEAVITTRLVEASDMIDALTFNRIVAIGWEHLTAFQQSKVTAACVRQAEFLVENADAIQSALSEYSINGVTMKFGNAALYELRGGIPVENMAWSLLKQTGLTSRMATYREVEPDALS